MSAQVLARKWRPKAFADLIGQEHICRTLINGLNAKRLHHAYLFCGTRGVGKTTLARILAKSFACERSQDAEPCNACPHCRAIDEGNYPDLLEVDAASRTGVEDTRELLGDTQFAPIRGKYKTYLIDEVHMLSNHSFNALLKTLEEPPPHILFLFATTDPQKVPITVLSRCLKFNLKPIQEDAIRQQLDKILKAEKIQYDPGSLKHLAQQARGSMRDALSLADQAIAYCRGKLQEDETAQMLGVAGIPPAAVLLKDLVQDDMKALLAVTERVENDGGNFSDFADRLLEALQSIAILQVNKTPAHEDPELRGLVTQLSPEEVQLYYQIVLLTKKELPWCPSPRRAFEMGLIRMLTLQPVLTENFVAIPKRVDRLKPDASQTQTMVSPAPDPQQEGNDAEKEGTEERVNESETIDVPDAVNPQPKQEKEPSDPPAKSETDPDTNSEDAKDKTTSQAGDASVASTRTVANEQETQAKTLDLGMATPEEQAEVDARSQSMKEKADDQDESSEAEEEIDTEDEAPKGKEETDTQDEVRRAGEEVDAEDEAPKGKEETDTQDEVRKAGEKAATEDESSKAKEEADAPDEARMAEEATEDESPRAEEEADAPDEARMAEEKTDTQDEAQEKPMAATDARRDDYTDPYRWDHLVQNLDPDLIKGELKASLYHSRLVNQTRDLWVVRCGLNDHKVLTKESEALRAAIETQVKHSIMLEIENGTVTKTPYLLRDERQRRLVQDTKRDPVVKMIAKELDAELNEASINASEPEVVK